MAPDFNEVVQVRASTSRGLVFIFSTFPPARDRSSALSLKPLSSSHSDSFQISPGASKATQRLRCQSVGRVGRNGQLPLAPISIKTTFPVKSLRSNGGMPVDQTDHRSDGRRDRRRLTKELPICLRARSIGSRLLAWPMPRESG